MNLRRLLPLLLAGLLLAPAASFAQSAPCCVLSDNGSGSANLPPNCAVGYTGAGEMTNGFPPGSTLQIAARLGSFINVIQGTGGGLGGEFQTWDANLELNLTGTGGFLGYSRLITLPVQGESHSAPRVPFAPVQSFNTDLFRLFGQTTSDPDFDFLRVTAGAAFNLPSPGQTTLTQVGGGWAVDSFFDITYRVDYIGRSGGPFAGMSGSTTNSLERFDMCHQTPTPVEPSSWGRLKASYR